LVGEKSLVLAILIREAVTRNQAFSSSLLRFAASTQVVCGSYWYADFVILRSFLWSSLMIHSINRLLLLSLAVTLTGAIATPSLADYVPPPNPHPPDSPISTGTRGCKSGVTLLVPFTHVGQTTSSHPTFAWFLPTNPKGTSVEFRLFDRDWHRVDIPEAEQPSAAVGLMRFSLPDELPPLTVGKRYHWQIVLDYYSEGTRCQSVAEAEIDVVGISPVPKLGATTPVGQKPRTAAESGLWYDALEQALGRSKTSIDQPSTAKLLTDLVNAERKSKSPRTVCPKSPLPTTEPAPKCPFQSWLDALEQVISTIKNP
jgi:hypothetical protein